MNWLCNVLVALNVFFVASSCAMEQNSVSKSSEKIYFDAIKPMRLCAIKGHDDYQIVVPIKRKATKHLGTHTDVSEHDECLYIPHKNITVCINEKNEVKQGREEGQVTIEDIFKKKVALNFNSSQDSEHYNGLVKSIPSYLSNAPMNLKMSRTINRIVEYFEKQCNFNEISHYALSVMTADELKSKNVTWSKLDSLPNTTPLLVVEGIMPTTKYTLAIPLLTSLATRYNEMSKADQVFSSPFFSGTFGAIEGTFNFQTYFTDYPLYASEKYDSKINEVSLPFFSADKWDDRLGATSPKTCYQYNPSQEITMDDKNIVHIPATLNGKLETLQFSLDDAISFKNPPEPACYVKTIDRGLVVLQFHNNQRSDLSTATKKISQEIPRLLAVNAITDIVKNMFSELFTNDKMLFTIELKQLYELKIAVENSANKTSDQINFYDTTLKQLLDTSNSTYNLLSPILIIDIQVPSNKAEKPYEHTLLAIPLSSIYDDGSNRSSQQNSSLKKADVIIPHHHYLSTDGFIEKKTITTVGNKNLVTFGGSKKDKWKNELDNILDEYQRENDQRDIKNRFKLHHFVALSNDPYYSPDARTITCDVYAIRDDVYNAKPYLVAQNQQLDTHLIQKNGDQTSVSLPNGEYYQAMVWQGIKNPGMSIQEKKDELFKNKRYFTPIKIAGLTTVAIIAYFVVRKLWRSF